jgi:hypothetical protein
MKANKLLLALGLVLFLALLGASIWKQSPILLYIASAIPIFIVPFLPDIRTAQKLHPSRQSVQIVKLTDAAGEEAEWFVVSFNPGTIYWNKKWLVIPTEGMNRVNEIHTDDYTASLTVLKYDLRTRKNHSGKISVYLPNLIERTKGLNYTVEDVNRLMIRMDDLEELMPLTAQAPVASHTVLNSTTQSGA